MPGLGPAVSNGTDRMSGEISRGGHAESGPVAWNVIVTLAEPTFRIARRLLARWGELRRTQYFNVAVMAVADPAAFLREFSAALAESPGILNAMSHVLPFEHVFEFTNAAEFEAKAREIALCYVPKLAGKAFHVRLHRRGLKGTISTPAEERFLDDVLLQALMAAGTPGRIGFEDPDCVLLLETLGERGGLALWTREDLKRYPFLGAI
jgi:tRNA(Ser,Leu) C12 N-acetylase TAN1